MKSHIMAVFTLAAHLAFSLEPAEQYKAFPQENGNKAETCPWWVGKEFGRCNSSHFGACRADSDAPRAISTQCISTKTLYSTYTCASHTPLKCVFEKEKGETLCENWVGQIFGSCNKDSDFGACHADAQAVQKITTQCIETKDQWDHWSCPESANIKCKFEHAPSPGTWPTFKNLAALQASPWSKYFSSVYGALPTSYPVRTIDLWCYHVDKISNAGITLPASVGKCPSSANAPTGERYDYNNIYSSKTLTWLWHPLDSVPYRGFPSHAIVEVSHRADPFGDENFGMWFVYASGNGVFLDLGVTKIFKHHPDAYNFFGANGNEDMCKKAAAAQFDTIQFIGHSDPVSYPCSQQIGASWLNMEIVAVKLVGTYPCGMAQDTPPSLRAGWNGANKCICDATQPTANCKTSMDSGTKVLV